ncbi:MAG: hypothetical protein LBI17_04105 [Rickettsiales bacterium]|jgi:tetratricopeptide (TPR) repeat protein|nr:hypothetical protein [Rickettsiales bacterium]
MKFRNTALAIAALVVAALFFSRGRDDGARRSDSRFGLNKYGLYLASYRAEIANDIFNLEDIYPEAVEQNGDDFLGKSFIIKAINGDSAGALADAGKEAERNPSNTLPAIYLAYSDFINGDYAAAGKRLDAAKGKSDTFIIRFLKSWVLFAEGRKEEAKKLLAAANGSRAFGKIALMHAAYQAEISGEIPLAGGFYAAAMHMKPDLSDVESAAGFFLRNGMRKKAVDIVSDFAGDLSSSVSASSLAAAIEGGYIPPAVDDPQKGMAKALFDISSILMRAFAFTNDLYIMYVGMSLELWPEFGMARVMQAEIFKKYGRTGQYAAALRMIPRSSYLYPLSRMNYASYLISIGSDDGKALKIYRELLSGYPGMAVLYQNVGDYYRAKGEYKKAVGYYTDGIGRADGKGDAGLYFSRAIAHDLSHDAARAVEDFELAFELDPKNPVLLNYYGYFLLLDGRDIEKGRRLVERAVRLEPLNPYYIDSYAWALFKSGAVDEAMKMAEYAKAFEPKNPVIMDHLGDIYWSAGRRREAVFEWSKAKARLKDGDVNGELNGISEYKLDRKIERGLESEPEDE